FYCRNFYSGSYGGKYYSELFDKVAFYIVPMANPDGVAISQYGPSGIRDKVLRNNVIKLYKKYGKGKYSYYTKWKANARGVNLNMNFDVYWKTTKVKSKATGDKGKKAVSELESKTLVNLFNEIKPVKSLSYHATGSIIYWNFGQTGNLKKTSYSLAKTIKSMTAYSFVNKFDKHQSAGFSDWVSIKEKTPAITLEIGKKSCPLSIKEFSKIWSKNRLMYALFAISA
ncbi:MAG TPA: M14 family zinc carboxypeptidase, partial [Mobilitalea sp.]|nr:M14 family zinc carboxypeptidase [Mobilitalea sp.]